MTIPSDPEAIKKLQELAERNIANGDWGDEVAIPGIPGGETPMTPEEREAKGFVSRVISKQGNSQIPKKKGG